MTRRSSPDFETEKTARPNRQTGLKLAENYCFYQERSQQELRNKLYELGFYKNEVEEIICEMILKDAVSEERFALAYVSGKFKINKWGKKKIRQGLKQKMVPDKMITRVLDTIDYDDYLMTLRTHAEKKNSLIKIRNPYKRKSVIVEYLLQKGFEYDLIKDVLKEMGM